MTTAETAKSLAAEATELLNEVDRLSDKLIEKVEYSKSHRMSASLFEDTRMVLAKVGGFLSVIRSESSSESLTGLKEAVEAQTKKWAYELRAATSYSFDPNLEISKRMRWQMVLKGVDQIAQELQEFKLIEEREQAEKL